MEQLVHNLIELGAGNWKIILLIAIIYYIVLLLFDRYHNYCEWRDSFIGALIIWSISLAIIFAIALVVLVVYLLYSIYENYGLLWSFAYVALLLGITFGIRAIIVSDDREWAIILAIVLVCLIGIMGLIFYLLWPGLMIIFYSDKFFSARDEFLTIGLFAALLDILIPNKRGKLGKAYTRRFNVSDLIISPFIAFCGEFFCACIIARVLGRVDTTAIALSCGLGAVILLWLSRPYRGGTWSL